MKDKLKDFIHQNRGAFDDQEPSDRVWKNIEGSVFFQKKTGLWNSVMIWRAAAMIFMALSVYLLIPKKSSGTSAISQNETVALKEFNDVESFYVKQISEKVELIDEFQRNEGLNGFTQDFQQLEAMYMVLKEEMRTRPSQKVKDALVLNLLVRIDLLNQQLHKLENESDNDNKPVEQSS